jgi:hypothetical protein
MAIDKHADTWRDIEQWLQARRENCILSLINGSTKDDKLRGEIRVIDDLLARASEELEPGNQPNPSY